MEKASLNLGTNGFTKEIFAIIKSPVQMDLFNTKTETNIKVIL